MYLLGWASDQGPASLAQQAAAFLQGLTYAGPLDSWAERTVRVLFPRDIGAVLAVEASLGELGLVEGGTALEGFGPVEGETALVLPDSPGESCQVLVVEETIQDQTETSCLALMEVHSEAPVHIGLSLSFLKEDSVGPLWVVQGGSPVCFEEACQCRKM